MRSLIAAAALVGAMLLAAPAGAKTPLPPRTAGAGAEPTSGSGVGAGAVFRPRFGVATYDALAGYYVLYLTSEPVKCAGVYLPRVPYLTVSIVTSGSPLVVGAPSLQRGDSDFVQVDFYVAATHYYSVQPKVVLVLTRVDAARNALWHGRLTVPVTHFEGKTFSFAGTFAARWCGRS